MQFPCSDALSYSHLAEGRVDIVIASELLEAARVLEKGYINPDSTTLITSSSRIYTNLEKSHLADGRFDEEKKTEKC